MGFRIGSVSEKGGINWITGKVPKELRLAKAEPYQMADPFLYYHESKGFYCFYEEKYKAEKGVLKALNLDNNYKLDVELLPGVHLSFPFLINHDNRTYLLPETAELNEVALYAEESFPIKWKKIEVLLKGEYVDSHIILLDKVFYLFSTLKENSQYSLKLFHSKNIEGPYAEHPKSPLHVGRKYGRSAGSVIQVAGKTYRFSQDCEIHYGKEVHMFEVLKLNETEYEEVLVQENLIKEKFQNSLGGHHISRVQHPKIGEVWAVDMNFKDSYFQRFIDKFFK
jgi:hypothetical protein